MAVQKGCSKKQNNPFFSCRCGTTRYKAVQCDKNAENYPAKCGKDFRRDAAKGKMRCGNWERTRPACPVRRLAERKKTQKRPARRRARQPRRSRSPNCYGCCIPGRRIKNVFYKAETIAFHCLFVIRHHHFIRQHKLPG